jgi:hypothetical protein
MESIEKLTGKKLSKRHVKTVDLTIERHEIIAQTKGRKKWKDHRDKVYNTFYDKQTCDFMLDSINREFSSDTLRYTKVSQRETFPSGDLFVSISAN